MDAHAVVEVAAVHSPALARGEASLLILSSPIGVLDRDEEVAGQCNLPRGRADCFTARPSQCAVPALGLFVRKQDI
jgi:hypothetical protein